MSIVYYDVHTIEAAHLPRRGGLDFRPLELETMYQGDTSVVLVGSTHLSKLLEHLPKATLIVLDETVAGFGKRPCEGTLVFEAPPTLLDSALFAEYLVAMAALGPREEKIRHLASELAMKKDEIVEINQMGVALGTIKDHATLHQYLLSTMRKLLKSDGASLYIVDPDDPGKLIFIYVQSFSRNLPFKSFKMPINSKSIAGYTAERNTIVNIADAYDISKDLPVTFDSSFDRLANYRTKSILSIPMTNHKNELLGVIQLINKKERSDVTLDTPEFIEHHVRAFEKSDEMLALSMANLAGISLENNQLYKSIENLFEGFIRASVSAIEQRDPTTSGHSRRVALYSLGLALSQTGHSAGPGIVFNNEQLKELYYAALLHDFGKIGVREHVLVKAKKLYDADLAILEARLALILDKMEKKALYEKIQILARNHGNLSDPAVLTVDKRFEQERERMLQLTKVIRDANEPAVLPEEACGLLHTCKEMQYEFDGEVFPVLTETEFSYLSVKRGSLNLEERLEIESHVTHTFNFLKKIPWTRELTKLADYAHAHHEKLDGTGYPLALKEADIPVQSRIMAIADIYDALTAWDRPYKKAMPVQKALDILRFEVEAGKLDRGLYTIFTDSKVYEIKEVAMQHDFDTLLQLLHKG
ncbi:MAG: hypothetical protein A2284_14705 [Deltaproteobacteria bacterium RIFOXYA12_FULL_61_11]|nr:MAG: hypothetical protein A2284_14705 [Deltaproteobacteria bacterium RIFOXYA12_FULL_61_11]